MHLIKCLIIHELCGSVLFPAWQGIKQTIARVSAVTDDVMPMQDTGFLVDVFDGRELGALQGHLVSSGVVAIPHHQVLSDVGTSSLPHFQLQHC